MSEDTIIEAIKFMRDNNLDDSTDIYFDYKDVWNEKFSDCPVADLIYIPDYISNYDFSKWDNCTLIGGYIDKCLAEIRIYLDSLNINYEPDLRYIY